MQISNGKRAGEDYHLKDWASIMVILLQICMQLGFVYFIYIPPMFKNVHVLINKTYNANLMFIFTYIYLIIFRLDIHITRFFPISP